MSLPRSEGAVSGWTPSVFDDDIVDVDLGNVQGMSHSASQNTYALGSSRSAYTRENVLTSPDYIPAFNRGGITSADKASSSAFAISSSDRRAIRNKLRDPTWVPRPRNAFIIFRCDYVREHARDTQGQTMPAIPSDKTLSKRAAEAWKKMTEEEKTIFHARAEAEKDEHARQNPHYRFKPMRRPGQQGSTSRGGSTSRHSSRGGSRQSSRGGSVSRGRGERASHGASRRRRGSNYANEVFGWDGGLSTSVEESGLHRRGRSPPPEGRRRSSSMPESMVWEQDLDAWPPALAPPSCSSSPGPWYDQTQGSSDSGDGRGDDELSPLDAFGGAVDDALFKNFNFPSNTSYFSSQASLGGRPGLYPSQSLPAQSQSSLATVRPRHFPTASQASLLTVRPNRHFPGASQSSLLTIRPRHPSQVSLIGLKPAPPRQRPVPPPPQIPVFQNPKPHQLSSLSSLSTALADFSYDANAPPAPASATPSDASNPHTPYSSDSETEGRPQHMAMPMPMPGLPIPRPRPRFPQPQPQSQPPPQPPPPPPPIPHAASHPVPIPSMTSGASGALDQPHAGSWGSDTFDPQPLPARPLRHATTLPVTIPSSGAPGGLSQPHTSSWGSDSFAAGGGLDPQPWDAQSFDGSNPSTSLPSGGLPPPPMWDDVDAFGAAPAPPVAPSAMDPDVARRVFWDAEAFGGFQDAPGQQGQADFGAQEFMQGQQALPEFAAQEYVQQEPMQQGYGQQDSMQRAAMQAQIQMRAHDPGQMQTHLEAQGQMHAQDPMYGHDPMQMQAHLHAQMQMHAQDPALQQHAMPQNPLQMQVPDLAAGYSSAGDIAGLEDFS